MSRTLTKLNWLNGKQPNKQSLAKCFTSHIYYYYILLSCSIKCKDQLLNVCLMAQDHASDEVMFLIVPADRMHIDYLSIAASEMQSTFKLLFGSYSSLLFMDKEKMQATKRQLDSFFTYLFKRLQLASLFPNLDSSQSFITSSGLFPNAQDPSIHNKFLIKQHLNLLIEMRSKLIDSLPFLDLPYHIKTDLDATLSDLEAQEFVDIVI